VLALKAVTIDTNGMFLRFETMAAQNDTDKIPILVDSESITVDSIIDGVKIDDSAVSLDHQILRTFQNVVSRINTEVLPPGHFRDCCHFTMAMCGIWMPTHALFDGDFSMKITCHDTADTKEHYGPVALGIPNDDRCLGFGDAAFVYAHSVFGVDSSIGFLCLSKLGIESEYSLSTFDTVLTEYDLAVSHPIHKLAVQTFGEEIVTWHR